MHRQNRSRNRIQSRIQSRIQHAMLAAFLAAVAILLLIPTIAVAGSPSDGQRILLMRNGRILRGDVRAISTGWLVSTGTGRLVVPTDQVRFDADNLSDAYLRLRIEIQRPTVATHLQLAEWCLSHQLHEEAARELRDALMKDSTNETARLMLHRVEEDWRRLNPDSATTESNDSGPTPRVEVGVSSTGQTNVRSLAGLRPETARGFIETVHPILSNKCGNARCHGAASPTEFRLERIRSGAGNNRIHVEKNLAATLQQILPLSPESSPLLTIGARAHAGQTIFNGQYGTVQLASLRDWVLAAGKDLAPPKGRVQSLLARADSPAAPFAESSDADGAVPTSETAETEAAFESSALEASFEASTIATLNESDVHVLPRTNFQKILEEAQSNVSASDPFDPEVFNRQFAGRSSRE